MKGWTEKKIKELHRTGKIRSYKVVKRQKELKDPAGRTVTKHFKKRSKEKDWISQNLLLWCNEHALQLQEEYKFHPERRWRFDWCIPALKIAIEYEGIFSKKSRHTNVNGYSGDVEKYNAATHLGWRIFRFTAKNYQDICKVLNALEQELTGR